jgi:hypothetical protein
VGPPPRGQTNLSQGAVLAPRGQIRLSPPLVCPRPWSVREKLPELALPTLVEALKQANPPERKQIVEALRTLRLLLDESCR